MSEQESNESKPLGDELIDGARRFADGADRWFISLARNLGRGARWTKDEAGVIADAAVAAGRTTGTVTRKVFNRLRTQPAEVKLSAQLSETLSALGQILADHGPDDYAALAKERKFWKLLSQAVALKEELDAAERAQAEAEAAAEEEPEEKPEQKPAPADAPVPPPPPPPPAAEPAPAPDKPAAASETDAAGPAASAPKTRPPKQAANVVAIRPGVDSVADAAQSPPGDASGPRATDPVPPGESRSDEKDPQDATDGGPGTAEQKGD